MSEGVEVRTIESAEVGGRDLDAVLSLFDRNYDRANHAYLERSFAKLGYLSLAETGGRVVGFAVGDAALAKFDGFDEPQAVALAGISCIDPDVRRQGLFSRLSFSSMGANGILQKASRFLFAGRMAHPITFRTMTTRSRGAVPRAHEEPSACHRHVALVVAELYGSTVDPDTFVVSGPGTPIGFPRLRYQATEDEESLFRNVDRSRGDSLLGLAWMPDAPEQW